MRRGEVLSYLSEIPSHLHPNHLKALVSLLDRLKVCPGHPDKKFVEMVEAKKGKLYSPAGSLNPYLDKNAAVRLNGIGYGATVRSKGCTIVTPGVCCTECTRYRDALRSVLHRWQKRKLSSLSPMTKTSSHTNYRWLTTPEKEKRNANM